MQIHWHRRDLRLTDNLGLAAAHDAGDTVAVFVFDRDVLSHAAPPRVAFMLDALEALREAYRNRGSDLLLASGPPADCLPALSRTLGADLVSWGADYSGLARERDAAVRRALDEAGVHRRVVDDAVHHAPGEITTNKGTPYKVFTYFSRKWHDQPKRDPPDPPGKERLWDGTSEDLSLDSGASRLLDSVPTLDDLGFEDPEATIPPAGTAVARDKLSSFLSDDVYAYGDRRDYPAEETTSRLSAHLKFGTLGIRTAYAATERAREEAGTEQESESVRTFQDQLAWREFYAQVLFDRPDVVTQNYKEYENPIEWRDDESELQAWKDGQTGYPLVDAGMRQLREEAFMHNRVRMVVASFLTKDLLIDWRQGYDWFREKLLDHDTANDNGGWQWAASTGTDAQPYFRIFNPMSQVESYDPDGEYVRRYVPELSDAPAEIIHTWHELDEDVRSEHAPAYPAPIVDHSERREQAISMFENARGN